MAGAFSDSPDYRMALDRDGSIVRAIQAGGTGWDDFTAAQRISLASETAVDVHAGSVATTNSYVVAFPTKRRVTGIYASVQQDDLGAAVRTNLIINPSFKAGTVGWTGTKGAVTQSTSSTPPQGANLLRLTSSDASAVAPWPSLQPVAAMPVVAGKNYILSTYARITTGTTLVFQLVISFYNSGGGLIFDVFSDITVPTAWTRFALSTAAPAGATTARVTVRVKNGGYPVGSAFDLDGVCFVQETADGGYFDGDSDFSAWTGMQGQSTSVTVPNQTTARYNLCTNPSFEVDTTDWGSSYGTLSRVTDIASPRGGAFMRLTAVSGGSSTSPNYIVHTPYTTVQPGTSYSGRAWVRCSVATTLRLYLRCRKGTSTFVNDIGTDVAVAANTWTSIAVSGVAGDGATTIRLHLSCVAGLPVGATMDIDAAYLAAETAPGLYFDGDSLQGVWSDAPHGSQSSMAPYSSVQSVAVAMDVSEDTTNGVDGTWSEIVMPDTLFDADTYGQFASLTKPGYRSGVLGGLAVPSVKAVRLRMSGSVPASSWRLQTLHLYGDRAYTAGVDTAYLAFYHPSANQGLFPTALDYGNVGDGDSQDRTLRLRNLSALKTANGITISVSTLTEATPSIKNQYLLSADGLTFVPSLTIAKLVPGAISQTIYLRKVTPYDAVNGPWTARLIATPASWS